MEQPPRPVICILNATAGPRPARTTPEQLAVAFAASGLAAEIWEAATGAELADLCARAVARKCAIVVAAGGDGTVNCVAAALAGTTATLGVLPLGTLNHLARDLRIPMDVAAAIDVIANGRRQAVDAGEVDGRLFLNNSSLGLYPQLVRERVRLQGQGAGKWTAFARAARHVLTRHAHLHVRIHAGSGANAIRTTPFVFIGNNEYRAEGWNIGTRARLDGGRLWICMAPRLGAAGLVLLALRSLLGLRGRDAIEVFETTECWIATRRSRIDVARDGEVEAMDSPLHYRIRPGALHVMVPAPQRPSGGNGQGRSG